MRCGLDIRRCSFGRFRDDAGPELARLGQSGTWRPSLTHVTVIDIERGRQLRDHTVIIEGGRISIVGPSAQVRVPDGYAVVEARGVLDHLRGQRGDEPAAAPLGRPNSGLSVRLV